MAASARHAPGMLPSVRCPAAQRPATADAPIPHARAPHGQLPPRPPPLTLPAAGRLLVFCLSSRSEPFDHRLVVKEPAGVSRCRRKFQVIVWSCPSWKKQSGRWGFRPLVGIGVMEVQTFEALGGGLEHTDRVPAQFGDVDRPEGSIGPGTKVPRARFAAFSLRAAAGAAASRLNRAERSVRLAEAATLPLRRERWATRGLRQDLERHGNKTRRHPGCGNASDGRGAPTSD
jgi:hypothetical protein